MLLLNGDCIEEMQKLIDDGKQVYDLLSDEFEVYKSEKDVLDKINTQKRKEIEAKEMLENKDNLEETKKKNDENQKLKEPKEQNKLDQSNEEPKNIEREKKSNKIETKFQKLSGLKKTGETLDLKSIEKGKFYFYKTPEQKIQTYDLIKKNLPWN